MMPQFWQIGATQWINPAHIVHVDDDPTATPPLLSVLLPTPAVGMARPSQEPHKLRLTGEARDTVLAYLARETETVPPPAQESWRAANTRLWASASSLHEHAALG